ncbi:DUF6663 family protein [Natranaeroarchaeum aerophilus]|uniref:Uncharacterized protein n=1 Tax=Natranaeroarchaeum aerophilus TaxID=2917711 RepID=A0AAE3FSD0_9EURY|nr:DUF6663 family protein [Natranaeroarchaeum aerophilus]MCL9814434.1 hypothetical protein [Natranaeroarchaeum aerophilus]
MDQTTDGRFRVLPGRSDDELLLLDPESAEPSYVPVPEGEAPAVGHLVDATLVWEDGDPVVAEYSVVTATTFRFIRTDEPAFEAARECFESARAEGAAMNSQITRDMDSDPNGVVYTFAEQAGERDLFGEFRDGVKPLEPLVARAAEAAEPPFSVWVLDTPEPFVLVYIVLGPDSLLERTMRDTYR